MTEEFRGRPIIRWAGSKKRLLPELFRATPQFTGKYLEPFAGSACLFFNINADRSCINDLNRNLIEFYRNVVNYPDDVYDMFYNIERSKEVYYEIRSKLNTIENEIERSAAFLYLNRNCFNGIYRVNKSGIFNVPFSNSRVAAYPTKQAFLQASKSLAKATLHSSDFETFCDENCSDGDFVYLDPPYYVPKTRVFREYNQTDFTEADTLRLAKLLDTINSRGANFLLSYPKGELTQQLCKAWYSKETRTARTVSGVVAARRSETEVMIANYFLG